MSGEITFNWPDADLEQLEAARGRIEVAGEELRAWPRARLVEAVGEVLERWRAPASPWRARLLDRHPDASGPGRAGVEAGLKVGLEDWGADALARLVDDELGPEPGEGARLSPFECTSVLLAGSIPMPGLLQGLLPLLVSSPVLIRPASRDPASAELLAASVADVDAELGRCIEVVRFAPHDRACLERFLASDCVVASGSDETIAELRSAMGPGRLVAYGHKFSIAALGGAALAGDALQAACEGLARDVALWNQAGCLSPIALYCVGATFAQAGAVAEALSAALAARELEWPRGEVPTEVAAGIRSARSEAELRAAAAEGARAARVFASAGTEHTVVVEPEPTLRASPLHRFVRVHAVEDAFALRAALAPHARHLSSAALAGFDRDEESLVTEMLSALGASRLCRPGRMQAPPLAWRHDGRPILIPLCRFTDVELD